MCDKKKQILVISKYSSLIFSRKKKKMDINKHCTLINKTWSPSIFNFIPKLFAEAKIKFLFAESRLRIG